jgi:hypothetical protein
LTLGGPVRRGKAHRVGARGVGGISASRNR